MLIGYVNKIQKPIVEKRIYVIANIVLISLASLVIGYIYSTGEMNRVMRFTIIALLVYTVLGLLFFIRDSKRANVVIERVSSVRGIDINQPIKLPK